MSVSVLVLIAQVRVMTSIKVVRQLMLMISMNLQHTMYYAFILAMILVLLITIRCG